MKPRPVPWVAGLEQAVHGSYHGPSPAGVIDFSANGNVIGPPPGLADALAGVEPSRYPDPSASALRAALAERHGLEVDQVLVGNGATELIWAMARAYLAPGSRALVVGPTYGEYAVASAACGAEAVECRVAAPGAELDLRSLAAALADRRFPLPLGEGARPAVVWLAHPNNPTGAAFPVDALAPLVDAAPETLFVVDEAYLPLCEGVPSALSLIDGGQVVVLRSMTKDFALAGLRLGYALGAPEVIGAVRRVVPHWSVNSYAQAGGLAVLGDEAHLDRAKRAVAQSCEHLMAGLRRPGLSPYPTVANFVLVPLPAPPGRGGQGAEVARALLERQLAVRDCASFGLADCIRIGVRRMEDQERLLAALEVVLHSVGLAPLLAGAGP